MQTQVTEQLESATPQVGLRRIKSRRLKLQGKNLKPETSVLQPGGGQAPPQGRRRRSAQECATLRPSHSRNGVKWASIASEASQRNNTREKHRVTEAVPRNLQSAPPPAGGKQIPE